MYQTLTTRIWRDGKVIADEDIREGDVISIENFYGGVARGFHLDPSDLTQPAKFKVGPIIPGEPVDLQFVSANPRYVRTTGKSRRAERRQ